jgi:hypothetical protein
VFSHQVAIVLGRKPSSNLRRIHSGRALATALVSRASLSRGRPSGALSPDLSAACAEIAATLALGTVAVEAERTGWQRAYLALSCGVLAKLKALRGPGEGYSDMISRLAKTIP